MGQNDLQHEQQVENQVSRLSALLQAIAEGRTNGAQVTQPVSLGSAGAPPFGSPDGSSLTSFTNGSGLSVDFNLVGPFVPPTEGTPNAGNASAAGCTLTPATNPTGISCATSKSVFWNFSAGSSTPYSFSQTGSGAVAANFTTSSSTISYKTTANTLNRVAVFGSQDTVYVNTTLALSSIRFVLVGSNDTVSFTQTGATSSIAILLLGNYDTVSVPALSTGAATVRMSAYGLHDTFSDLVAAASVATVYYTGFSITNPNSNLCPYGNLATSDGVSGTAVAGTVFYNNTNYSHANGTANGWTSRYSNPAPFACPYVAGATVAPTAVPTGFIVGIRNTYVPFAQVVYDQGAVVFAQSGGIPVIVVPPSITWANGVLSLFVPYFSSLVPGEVGAGTADVSLRLLSTTTFSVPSNAFKLSSGTNVTISLTSPYAAAWYSYFLASTTFASHTNCTAPAWSDVCSTTSAFYNPSGPLELGTVTLTIPVKGLTLDLLTATYSVRIL